ncbi:MAG: FkbM family methyltransferase [Candidatus Tantalella remota]|nr:FkbM family methyltransferase [Candidatus Tantalella remota]
MEKVISSVKNLLKPVLCLFLRLLPNAVFRSLFVKAPRLLPYCPQNRKFVFNAYLKDIKVNVHTVYPIEREMLAGYYDKSMLGVIDNFVKKGDVCFDIGANVGPVSFALAKKSGSEGQVFAFEPGRLIYNRLMDNIRLNPEYGKIIQPYKTGFSDKTEARDWNEDKTNRGNAGFIIQGPNQEERVELITVDDFVREQRVKKLDFIKIDVEGMEYEVIKGARKTLEEQKPTLYYETGFFEKGFWAEIARGEQVILFIEQLLIGMGYGIYKQEGESLRETRYPDLSYNTIAIWRGREAL